MRLIFKTLILFILVFTCKSIHAQKFEPVEKIPEGKALVYIYRPKVKLGAVYHYTVNANDEKVSEAHLKYNTYLVYFANPGRYTFWGEVSAARKSVDLDIEAGKTYYIRGDSRKFIIPTMEKAMKEIKKCKLSTVKNKK